MCHSLASLETEMTVRQASCFQHMSRSLTSTSRPSWKPTVGSCLQLLSVKTFHLTLLQHRFVGKLLQLWPLTVGSVHLGYKKMYTVLYTLGCEYVYVIGKSYPQHDSDRPTRHDHHSACLCGSSYSDRFWHLTSSILSLNSMFCLS